MYNLFFYGSLVPLTAFGLVASFYHYYDILFIFPTFLCQILFLRYTLKTQARASALALIIF